MHWRAFVRLWTHSSVYALSAHTTFIGCLLLVNVWQPIFETPQKVIKHNIPVHLVALELNLVCQKNWEMVFYLNPYRLVHMSFGLGVGSKNNIYSTYPPIFSRTLHASSSIVSLSYTYTTIIPSVDSFPPYDSPWRVPVISRSQLLHLNGWHGFSVLSYDIKFCHRPQEKVCV